MGEGYVAHCECLDEELMGNSATRAVVLDGELSDELEIQSQ